MFITQLCLTLCNPWTVARQAPLSMRFSRQEYWSGLPFPSPGVLPNQWIQPVFPVSLALHADSLHTKPLGKPKASTRSWAWMAWGTGQQVVGKSMKWGRGEAITRPDYPPHPACGKDGPIAHAGSMRATLRHLGSVEEGEGSPSCGPHWGWPMRLHRRWVQLSNG